MSEKNGDRFLENGQQKRTGEVRPYDASLLDFQRAVELVPIKNRLFQIKKLDGQWGGEILR